MRNQPVRPAERGALTDVENLDEKFAQLESCLAQSQRLAAMGTLAAGVAHEINNILTPVLSYAHLASSHADDQQLREKAFAKIIAGVESACLVAQTMLNYSRPRGEDTVSDLDTVIDDALGCLGRKPEKDRIEIVRRVRPITRVRIQPHALQQVLLNLILNARAALGGRQGTITIESSPQPSGDIRIVVSDTGPGIPAGMVETIFEPFVSTRDDADDRTPGPEGGTGLGLMVTRHLVIQAGGSIAVDAAPGGGARFTIVLPPAPCSAAKAG